MDPKTGSDAQQAGVSKHGIVTHGGPTRSVPPLPMPAPPASFAQREPGQNAIDCHNDWTAYQSRSARDSRTNNRYDSMSYSGGNNSHGNDLRHQTSPPNHVKSFVPHDRDSAGHKRKLEALRSPYSHNSARKKAPDPPMAPTVPSFGGSSLGSRPSLPPKPASSKFSGGHRPLTSQKNPSQSRSLGLTIKRNGSQFAAESDDDESEEEDEDEEATLLGRLSNNFTFIDHNLNKVSIETNADMNAWRAERQRNFPSRAQIDSKLERKRREGTKRIELLNTARMDLFSARMVWSTKARQRSNRSRSINSSNLPLGPQIQGQEVLTEQETPEPHGESVSERAKKPDEVMRDTEARLNNGSKEYSRVATSSTISLDIREDAVASADSDTASRSDDDTPPEEVSSKAHKNQLDILQQENQPSPTSMSQLPSSEPQMQTTKSDRPPTEPQKPKKKKLCGFFNREGGCRDGDKCMYSHTTSEAPIPGKGRKVIETKVHDCGPGYDMDRAKPSHGYLTEILKSQGKGEENILTLKVIKYLGQAGLFAQLSTRSETSVNA